MKEIEKKQKVNKSCLFEGPMIISFKVFSLKLMGTKEVNTYTTAGPSVPESH